MIKLAIPSVSDKVVIITKRASLTYRTFNAVCRYSCPEVRMGLQ